MFGVGWGGNFKWGNVYVRCLRPGVYFRGVDGYIGILRHCHKRLDIGPDVSLLSHWLNVGANAFSNPYAKFVIYLLISLPAYSQPTF